VCRAKGDKGALVRVGRTAEGVVIDESGKGPGRGAYVCRNRGCLENARLHARLAHALRTPLGPADRARIAAFVASLAPGTASEAVAAHGAAVTSPDRAPPPGGAVDRRIHG